MRISSVYTHIYVYKVLCTSDVTCKCANAFAHSERASLSDMKNDLNWGTNQDTVS